MPMPETFFSNYPVFLRKDGIALDVTYNTFVDHIVEGLKNTSYLLKCQKWKSGVDPPCLGTSMKKGFLPLEPRI